MSSDEEGDNEIIRCWCNAEGTVDELFAWEGLDESCGGSGELHCYCGGDFCVCHFHGSTECDGCPDCTDDDDDFDGQAEGFDDVYEE